jgi:hypothetical protein
MSHKDQSKLQKFSNNFQKILKTMRSAINRLIRDPDIQEEERTLANLSVDEPREQPTASSMTANCRSVQPYRYVALTMNGNSFQGNKDTAQLLREAGGGDTIRHMTDLFYQKAFADPHLDQFIASHGDPHHTRLGNWIVEKMGGEGNIWTTERATRSHDPVTLAGGRQHVVHDRTSAHSAAWHCPKREAHLVGEHFQLHDSRVWMRLMFWSAREAGVFDASPSFGDWYIRFIAHFVRVYEREAPAFARESARWSLSKDNIEEYIRNGNAMGEDVLGSDGMGVPLRVALRQLPAEERNDTQWPYHVRGN